MHLFGGNIGGPGLLALPLSVARAGPASGMVIMAVVVLQGSYGQWLLARLERALGAATATCTRPARRLGIEEVAQLVFPYTGRAAVSACILAMQLGVCSVFMGLVAENARAATHDWATREQWVLIAFVPCALLSQLPDLSHLWCAHTARRSQRRSLAPSLRHDEMIAWTAVVQLLLCGVAGRCRR